METDWKQLAEKYRLELEVYALAYEMDVLQPLRVIDTMRGALIQMESERIKFEIKRGKNEKSKETGERIEILMNGLDEMISIAGKNVTLKRQLKYKSVTLIQAEEEIENLRKQLTWDDSAKL